VVVKTPPVQNPCIDPLGRLSRDIAVSSGKRLRLTKRDLIWFRKLSRHGHLPSTFLHEFSKNSHKSEKRARERLKDLFREANTDHNGAYLLRPWQQNLTINPRNNHLVYALSKYGERMIKGEGLYESNTPRSSCSWKHDFLRSCVSASRELSCLAMPDLCEYVSHHEVVEKIGRDDFSANGVMVRPDVIDGIRFKKTGNILLFPTEIDCNTEPNESKNQNRKSYFKKKLLQYKTFISNKFYRSLWGIAGGVIMMTVTTNRTHMLNLMRTADRLFQHRGSIFMGFQYVSGFEYYLKPPLPMTDFLTKPIQRPGKPPLILSELKG